MRYHTVRYARSIILPARIVVYVKSVTSARERVMSNLKEWVEDRQENGDDGTEYEGESNE